MAVPSVRPVSSEGNLVLSAVPAEERERWRARMASVTLTAGQTLYRAGDRVAHLYFPLDCVIAVLGMSHAGATLGLALVGKDGLVGIGAALGDRRATGCALVQNAGRCWQVPVACFGASFERSHPLRSIVLRYVSSTVSQMAQTSLCNSHHSVDQRLRRWLLHTLDLLPSADLRTTQDSIAIVLGVRREAVTVAALRLQGLGAIRYTRGHIRVLNRGLVHLGCCECYDAIKEELDRAALEMAAP